MAERYCFSALPGYLQELPGGCRQGSVSREGYETAFDAAGHPFPNSERDARLLPTVDTLPSKRREPLASFDRKGAATGAPLTEVRALHVDDHVRRALSEPPRHLETVGSKLLSMQSFGVLPGIDCPISGRRRSLSPEFSPPTRTEIGKRAVQYGDIVDVPRKKRMEKGFAPGSFSPRLSAVAMECIDIDQHAGRKRSSSYQAASKGIVPLESPSFSLECASEPLKASPRCRSLQYFEKTLEAERYARLIGRPHAGTLKEIQRVRLALELQRQKETEEEAPSRIKHQLSRLSMLSTTASGASEGSLPTLSPRSQPPSSPKCRMSRSKSPVPLSAASRSVFEHWNDEEADLITASQDGNSESVPVVVANTPPLGVRRLMASLLPDADAMSEDLMHDLRSVISTSMQSFGKHHGAQRTRRFGCSPPRRPANRRNGQRS
jgi:hypothetical protein